MSGVAVIRALLAGNGALTAAIAAIAAAEDVSIPAPADQIMAGIIPLNTPLPAVGIRQISSTERLTLYMGEPHKLVTERAQVTVMANSYQRQKALMKLLKPAAPNQRGTIGGIDVDSILPDVEGPDDEDVDAAIFSQSQDFLVKWLRIVP